jgi:hypothetical protein
MSTSSPSPKTAAELECFVSRLAGVPEALAKPVARLLCTDIFPGDSWAGRSDEELREAARRAFTQVRAESRAFGVWELRRRAFRLAGITEDRLWLELLRDNQPEIGRCRRTLDDLRQVVDGCESAEHAGYLQAA